MYSLKMADNAEVLQQIKRCSGTSYSALTPNLKGFQAAVRSYYWLCSYIYILYLQVNANVNEVAIFGAASETFSKYT